MSWFLPSATVAIQRGSKVDEFGDEVDAKTVVAQGLPCLIAESVQRSFAPSEGRGGVVELYTLRFRPGTVLREQDRVVDERTGSVYLVTGVYSTSPVVGPPDVRAEARRVAAASG